MARLTQALILLLASASMVDAAATATAANPIRKVVTMLQNMQTKVTEEGKKEQDLFEKFMCYCKTSGGDLDASIQAAKDKIEATASALEAATKKKAQTEADLKEHQTSKADAETAMAEATAIREKEAAAYAQEKSDLETNLAALGKAQRPEDGSLLGSTSSEVLLVQTYAGDLEILHRSSN